MGDSLNNIYASAHVSIQEFAECDYVGCIIITDSIVSWHLEKAVFVSSDPASINLELCLVKPGIHQPLAGTHLFS